jgi:hypothetical protein
LVTAVRSSIRQIGSRQARRRLAGGVNGLVGGELSGIGNRLRWVEIDAGVQQPLGDQDGAVQARLDRGQSPDRPDRTFAKQGARRRGSGSTRKAPGSSSGEATAVMSASLAGICPD